jgi:hypothetical protein
VDRERLGIKGLELKMRGNHFSELSASWRLPSRQASRTRQGVTSFNAPLGLIAFRKQTQRQD